MSEEIVAGLDVGTTKVCAIVAETGPNGTLKIIGVGITPCGGLRKGVVVDLAETARAIKESVAKAAQQGSVDIHRVTVGITGEHIASMNTRGSIAVSRPGGEITEADRQRTLESARSIPCPPDRQIFHVEPIHYTVDGHNGIQKPVGMSGSRLEVDAHVVTVAQSPVENLIRAVERAGYHLDEGGAVLESLAAAEAVLTPEEREIGVALLDIGGGTTDLAVFHRGTVVHTAVIPVGGWHVTHDLSLGLQISEEEAERLKREYGTTQVESIPEEEIIDVRRPGSEEPIPLPRRLLAQIIGPRMEELFELAGQQIKDSGIGRPGAGLVLTGGASQLAGTIKTAEGVLKGLEIRQGIPRCAGGLADKVAKPPFAAAVGLVMLAGKRIAREQQAEEEEHLLAPVQGWFGRFVRGMLNGKGKR